MRCGKFAVPVFSFTGGKCHTRPKKLFFLNVECKEGRNVTMTKLQKNEHKGVGLTLMYIISNKKVYSHRIFLKITGYLEYLLKTIMVQFG